MYPVDVPSTILPIFRSNGELTILLTFYLCERKRKRKTKRKRKRKKKRKRKET